MTTVSSIALSQEKREAIDIAICDALSKNPELYILSLPERSLENYRSNEYLAGWYNLYEFLHDHNTISWGKLYDKIQQQLSVIAPEITKNYFMQRIRLHYRVVNFKKPYYSPRAPRIYIDSKNNDVMTTSEFKQITNNMPPEQIIKIFEQHKGNRIQQADKLFKDEEHRKKFLATPSSGILKYVADLRAEKINKLTQLQKDQEFAEDFIKNNISGNGPK